MSFNLASGQSGALLIRSHPLGIGEGFELEMSDDDHKLLCLNPLGIGEGFEHELITRVIDSGQS